MVLRLTTDFSSPFFVSDGNVALRVLSGWNSIENRIWGLDEDIGPCYPFLFSAVISD